MSPSPEHDSSLASGGVAISVRNLSYAYETASGALPVLAGVDIEIAAGDVVAVAGASGSGKTTLLSVLGGLDRPESGTVFVGGEDLGRLSRDDLARYRRETVGFVFQDFGLLGQLTALENVELALTIAGAAKRWRRLRAWEFLDAVGLHERAAHRPRALSGGEKQRVAIARALANSPRLILADEPTGNLDSATGGSIVELLLNLVRAEKKTLVVVTHDRALAQRGDRTLEMRDGVIV